MQCASSSRSLIYSCAGEANALASPPSWQRPLASSAAQGLEAQPMHSLRGKTFCVTGSTDGIGLHTAQLLAQSGATVLVHGR